MPAACGPAFVRQLPSRAGRGPPQRSYRPGADLQRDREWGKGVGSREEGRRGRGRLGGGGRAHALTCACLEAHGWRPVGADPHPPQTRIGRKIEDEGRGTRDENENEDENEDEGRERGRGMIGEGTMGRRAAGCAHPTQRVGFDYRFRSPPAFARLRRGRRVATRERGSAPTADPDRTDGLSVSLPGWGRSCSSPSCRSGSGGNWGGPCAGGSAGPSRRRSTGSWYRPSW